MCIAHSSASPTVPEADPLTAVGVVDSHMVVEYDSRRKPFPKRDAAGVSTAVHGRCFSSTASVFYRHARRGFAWQCNTLCVDL